MNPTTRNRVILFSGPNFIALSFLEYAVSKNFFITIHSHDTKRWELLSRHITQKKRFKIDNDSKTPEFSDVDYVVCINGYDEKLINKFKISNDIKTLIISPFEKYDDYSKIIPNGSNIASVYLGDVYGPRMDLDSQLLINQVIKETLTARKLNLPVGELFYPLFVYDAVKELFSYMFSFGPFGKELLLLGHETSATNLWMEFKKSFGELNLSFDIKKNDRRLPRNVERKTLRSDLTNTLSETFKWVYKDVEKETPKVEEKVNKKTNKINSFTKYIILTVFTLMVSPIILLLISSIFYYSAYKSYDLSRISITKPLLIASREVSAFFSDIPILGRFYLETKYLSEIGISSSSIVNSVSPLISSTSSLFVGMLGNNIYDPNEIVQPILVNLSGVYEEVVKLNINLSNEEYKDLYIKKEFDKRIDLAKVKSLIIEADVIFKNLAEVLGSTKPKTYLVLFQNNMELRPTGGFIGSYGLVTFEKGRLIDIAVSDVYSADGQLKGHVEPPAPIREYLGEAGWYLRDSNWDPDFTVSAKRAEWFLDKEIGRTVDGVFAIDLTPIKDILALTGPIFLSDYDMDITNENLYEKTQQEVESNFFAGSRKKASFLTALSRNLLTRFSESDATQRLKILREIYYNLERRHIQLYIHNKEVQDSINRLSWDGGVKSPNCSSDCYADMAGIVEANLGVNKVNQFIKRKANIDVSIDEGFIVRKLTLDIDNTANVSLGPSGRYRVYIRVLKNSDTENPDDGQFVEILPSSKKVIEFTWRSQIPENFDINKYKFYFRKQAGVTDFPFSLTINGKNLYNSNLDRDLFVSY